MPRFVLLAVLAAALASFALGASPQSIASGRRLPLRAQRPVFPAPCTPVTLAAPTYAADVALSAWSACGASAWPFTAAYTPNGSDLYVPLFGGLTTSGGCVLARLDPATLQLRGSVVTGLGPQDVAFVTRADGSMRLGFVSNSWDGSVTVFDEFDQTVATIPIPPDPNGAWPTAFPSGLATSPDQATVHVGTLDGQGRVHAIDVQTLQLDAAREIALGPGASAARMAFAGDELVLGVARYLAGSTGSQAEVVVVDPQTPHAARRLVLVAAVGTGLFPSVQDLAVDCDGSVWLAGFDLGARVFNVDPEGPSLVATVPTQTSNADGKFQALGLSRAGLLVTVDLFTHEIAAIDARRRQWMGLVDVSLAPTVYRGGQDVVFSPDGARMVIPWAASDGLAVFDL